MPCVVCKLTTIVDVDDEKLNDLFINLPSSLKINSNDIYHRCGDKSFSRSLLRKKRFTVKGQNVIQAEEQMSGVRLSEATSNSLENEVQPLFESRRLL